LRKRDLLGHKGVSLEVHSLDMRYSIKCLHWSQLRKRCKCWWTLGAKLSHLSQSLQLSHCIVNRNWRKRDIWEFRRSFSRSTWLTFSLCHYLELLWSHWSLALFGLMVVRLHDLWLNLNRIVSLMQLLKLQESIALCLFILSISLEFFRDEFLQWIHSFFSILRYAFFAVFLLIVAIGLMSTKPLIVSWWVFLSWGVLDLIYFFFVSFSNFFKHLLLFFQVFIIELLKLVQVIVFIFFAWSISVFDSLGNCSSFLHFFFLCMCLHVKLVLNFD